jgi:plasmid stability protein
MLNMADFFAVRNLDEQTREFISRYAKEHSLSMAEAIREISMLAREKMQERKEGKPASVFTAYEKIKFSSGNPKLSGEIDKILYGKGRKRAGGHNDSA